MVPTVPQLRSNNNNNGSSIISPVAVPSGNHLFYCDHVRFNYVAGRGYFEADYFYLGAFLPGALLANLAASLPPWVSYLTYDNILNDRAVKALIAILETMGKLSVGQEKSVASNRMAFPPGVSQPVGQKQGSFRFFGVTNCPHLSPDVWASFFELLGRSQTPMASHSPRPLSTLRCLDLSGNELGDEACAFIFDTVHKKRVRMFT